MPDVAFVVQLAEVKSAAEFESVAGRWGHRTDPVSGLPTDHGVTISVPIAYDDRQTGRHGFYHGQPETLLNVVRQGQEDIRRCPRLVASQRISAIDEVNSSISAEPPSGLGVGTLRGRVVEATNMDEVKCLSDAARNPLDCSALWDGMGLTVKAQTAEKEDDDVLFHDAESLAEGGASLLPCGSSLVARAIDAERDDR